MLPSARKKKRTGAGASKLRCVSMRWKPTPMPSTVAA
jgi:hypothetical protein